MSAPAPVAAPGPASSAAATTSTPGPVTEPVAVTGDGSTARTRAVSRWRRWRFPLALLALVVLVGLLAALPEPRTSAVSLAPDNPAADGARALAQVLADRGVEVTFVRSTSEAVAAADAGTTLLVTGDALLDLGQMQDVASTEADLVLLDPTALLHEVTTAAARSWMGADDERTTRSAECTDPAAQAAGTLRSAGPGFTALAPEALTCFPLGSGDPGSGAYLVVEGERRITAFADPRLLRNDTIADEGHAALALWALGRHDRLVWYVPSLDDFGQDEDAPVGPPIGDVLPPWAGVLGLQLVVVVAVAALWRGRRLGRVVTEPLPVTVRAAEATRGRGRLYRRARSYGHAAAALRAGSAARSAHRLGLPRSAGAHTVIDALAQATGRPTDEVAGLLYGPPPKDDAGLTQLARRLDELESEVHRS